LLHYIVFKVQSFSKHQRNPALTVLCQWALKTKQCKWNSVNVSPVIGQVSLPLLPVSHIDQELKSFLDWLEHLTV
jgi:hypothetical protein